MFEYIHLFNRAETKRQPITIKQSDSIMHIGYVSEIGVGVVFLVCMHCVLASNEWVPLRLDCYYKRGAFYSKTAEYWYVSDGKYWAYWDWNGKGPEDPDDFQCWRGIWEQDIPPFCQDVSSRESCLNRKECSYYPVYAKSVRCSEYPPSLDGFTYFWKRGAATPMWARDATGKWFHYQLQGPEDGIQIVRGWVSRVLIPPMCNVMHGGQTECLIQVGSAEYRTWPRDHRPLYQA